jgi:hypothetical protein
MVDNTAVDRRLSALLELRSLTSDHAGDAASDRSKRENHVLPKISQRLKTVLAS